MNTLRSEGIERSAVGALLNTRRREGIERGTEGAPLKSRRPSHQTLKRAELTR